MEDGGHEGEEGESMASGQDVGEGWLRFWDSAENDYYYFHTESEVTSWDLPPHLAAWQKQRDEAEDEVNDGQGGEGASSAGAAGGAEGRGEDNGDGVDVGDGWRWFWSEEEQARYYFHEESNTTTWDPPHAVSAVSEPEWAKKFGGKAYPEDAWKVAARTAGSYVGVDDEDEAHWRKSRKQQTARTKYPDGYDWDTYAREYGIASGWEAYGMHYGVSPEDTVVGGVPAQSMPQGSLIYEGRKEEDAMSRLERILGGKIEASEHEPPSGVLTQAQKIFGTDKTFTKELVHRGVMEAAAKAAGYDLDAAKEDAANPASIRDVQAHPTDIARMGYDRAQRHAELMAMAMPPPPGSAGGGSYSQTATFNKRTGRFEGHGTVVRMGVTDDRRQTGHYFDYDKWCEQKQGEKGGGPPKKKAKTGLGL